MSEVLLEYKKIEKNLDSLQLETLQQPWATYAWTAIWEKGVSPFLVHVNLTFVAATESVLWQIYIHAHWTFNYFILYGDDKEKLDSIGPQMFS